MSGRYFPDIVIALPRKYLDTLADVVPQREKYIERLWEENQIDDKIKVQFMYNRCEIGTEIPIIFSLWFAEKLASKYLKWCKEDLANKEAISKRIAISHCIRAKRPYSNCLT